MNETWNCPHCGEPVDDPDQDDLGWCFSKCGFVARTSEIFEKWYKNPLAWEQECQRRKLEDGNTG